MEVLLQSNSITDFLTRFEYLKYIANNDQKLLDEVTALKNSLEILSIHFAVAVSHQYYSPQNLSSVQRR